jgi:hypothetical protein
MEASGKSESATEQHGEKVNIPPCPKCGSHKVGSVQFNFNIPVDLSFYFKVKVTELEAGESLLTVSRNSFQGPHIYVPTFGCTIYCTLCIKL